MWFRANMCIQILSGQNLISHRSIASWILHTGSRLFRRQKKLPVISMDFNHEKRMFSAFWNKSHKVQNSKLHYLIYDFIINGGELCVTFKILFPIYLHMPFNQWYIFNVYVCTCILNIRIGYNKSIRTKVVK